MLVDGNGSFKFESKLLLELVVLDDLDPKLEPQIEA